MSVADNKGTGDRFVDMVSAVADVDLKLSDFHPRSSLETSVHSVQRARFPVIDYHNHLDSTEPAEVLAIMDQCNIEHVVNITMRVGEAALSIMDRFHSAAPDRFSSIGWMDWEGVDRADFAQLTIDRLHRMIEHGACGIKFWKDLGLTLRDE